jgi:glyoxylase-like metal-dependent hydrolase (beta-lactamase superfamily II)
MSNMSKIIFKRFVFNEIEVNTFILYDDSGEAVIIDPGCNTPDQCKQLEDFIDSQKLNPVAVMNTHGHFDHIFGNAWVTKRYNCLLYIHREDLPLLEHADKYAGIFGFTVSSEVMPSAFLEHHQSFPFGNSWLKVLHVPGHSPGSIAFYAEKDKLLFCGDILFRGSIGRTDLPGGNHSLLIKGIRERILTLPRDVLVWPGHGPETQIGYEHDTNPFLK